MSLAFAISRRITTPTTHSSRTNDTSWQSGWGKYLKDLTNLLFSNKKTRRVLFLQFAFVDKLVNMKTFILHNHARYIYFCDLKLPQFSAARLTKICAVSLNQEMTNLTGLRGQDQRPRMELDRAQMSPETVNIPEQHVQYTTSLKTLSYIQTITSFSLCCSGKAKPI